MQFLHGKIRAHIIAAEGLPDWDTAFFNISGKDTTDPYVCGELGHARLFKTKYVENELNPKWDEVFDVYVCHYATTLRIHVKDKEHIGASWIASCDIRCVSVTKAAFTAAIYVRSRDKRHTVIILLIDVRTSCPAP